jgi:hypothetical protein
MARTSFACARFIVLFLGASVLHIGQSLADSCECKSCNNAECCLKILPVCSTDCDTYTWDSGNVACKDDIENSGACCPGTIQPAPDESRLGKMKPSKRSRSFSAKTYTTSAIERLFEGKSR